MYLKQLELVGFKSFPQRTRLVFGPGITAIVGPNGSGKSNVADAVRWVLGEQSARALRGRRGEDVIFAGGGRRHPLGMAEVSLLLDNGDGRVALPYAEVAVARRLYRSGESEYLVNGSRVRLRDVTEWLLGAGLGPDSYCVVGQGTIEQLVLQRPEERRGLLGGAGGGRGCPGGGGGGWLPAARSAAPGSWRRRRAWRPRTTARPWLTRRRAWRR